MRDGSNGRDGTGGDGDPRIVVDFDDEGRKRLSARYANLTPAG